MFEKIRMIFMITKMKRDTIKYRNKYLEAMFHKFSDNAYVIAKEIAHAFNNHLLETGERANKIELKSDSKITEIVNEILSEDFISKMNLPEYIDIDDVIDWVDDFLKYMYNGTIVMEDTKEIYHVVLYSY